MGKEIIVYAYVVADILNVGHLFHLKNAKSLGDKLIVGVLSVSATMERKSKPILSLIERMQIIKALGFVDCVVPQEKYSPLPNVIKIKPDILMESTSHSKDMVEEAEMVMKSIGGKVIIMPYYSDISSTKIKDKIRNE